MIKIRAIEKQDISRIAEIHVYGRRIAYKGFMPHKFLFGESTVAKAIERFTEDNHEGYVFEEGGIIKGFATIEKWPEDERKNTLRLHKIFIEPAFQGQGIGKALIKQVEKTAAEFNYEFISMWVFDDNHDARTFYEKMGYYQDGVSRFSERNGVAFSSYTKAVVK